MKSILLFVLASLIASMSFAQMDSSEADEQAPSKSTLTLAALYANSANYYGQKSQENTSYGAIAATYRLKFGLYFSGLAYRLLKDSTGLASAGSAGAGFQFNIGKKFSADLSFTHSFFAAYSPMLQAGNAENASLTMTWKGWLNYSITGDYAFGKTNDEFVTAAMSKSINLFSLTSKDIITISPAVSIVGGTQHFYQSYLQEKKLRDSLLGIIGPILGNPSPGNDSTKVTSTLFNLLSYSLKLPLAYNRANYLVELDYELAMLSQQAQSGAGKLNSFLTLSFYYQF